MALTTLDQLKLHLGIAHDLQDEFLTQLLGAVEWAFKNLTQRRFELVEDETVYLCGHGTQILLLPDYPVREVAEVRVDPEGRWGQNPQGFGTDTLLEQGTQWALVMDGRPEATEEASTQISETGRLMRVNGVWPGRWVRGRGMLTPQLESGDGNIRVIYTSGYDPIPEDIQLAIWQLVAQLKSSRQLGFPYQSERFQSYGYTLAQMRQDASAAWQVGTPASVVALYKRLTPRFDVIG